MVKGNKKENSKGKAKSALDVSEWQPKTRLGQQVKAGQITNVSEILDYGRRILEREIVDVLLPNLKSELLLIGQAKGKFGGGQRRVFKQTQKKTREGNKPQFATYAVVGNGDGYVGVGYGKSKETVPAREKAIRNAKLNMMMVRRGCGSWQCGCGTPHTIPFKVTGKCGSSVIELIPAPKGTGLVVERECSKMLSMAGITDVWSRTYGQTNTKTNLLRACELALKQTMITKVKPEHCDSFGVYEGDSKITVETAEQ